jgi:TusA-related sulfurtransferase
MDGTDATGRLALRDGGVDAGSSRNDGSQGRQAMLVIEIPVRHTIDARGVSRVVARLRLVRAMAAAEVGDIVAMWTDDASLRIDLPGWVREAGYRLIGIEARDGFDEVFVERRR